MWRSFFVCKVSNRRVRDLLQLSKPPGPYRDSNPHYWSVKKKTIYTVTQTIAPLACLSRLPAFTYVGLGTDEGRGGERRGWSSCGAEGEVMRGYEAVVITDCNDRLLVIIGC